MKPENSPQDEFDPNDPPSKSAVKREMLALKDLGKVLCDLPFEKVKKAPVSESMLEAIAHFHKAKGFGAKKRQLQYIGKVMRQENAEEIEKWVNGDSVEQKLQVLHMHAAEQWRDRLIAEPKTLQNLIEAYPAAQALNLNVLIRGAAQERANQKPPKLYRELYQQLYAVIKGQSAAQAPADNGTDEGDFDDEY